MLRFILLTLGATLLSAALWAQSSIRFTLKEPTNLRVSVPTSVGVIEGVIRVSDIDLRGPAGWNRFAFRLTLDPASFSSGDSLRDRYVSEKILKAHLGNISFYALERIAPTRNAEGQPEGYPKAKGWLDPARQGAYLEIPYQWRKMEEGGILEFTHQVPLKSLGIPTLKHPFVDVTGPVTLSLKANMVRPSSLK
jgi:hypothetical protein